MLNCIPFVGTFYVTASLSKKGKGQPKIAEDMTLCKAIISTQCVPFFYLLFVLYFDDTCLAIIASNFVGVDFPTFCAFGIEKWQSVFVSCQDSQSE